MRKLIIRWLGLEGRLRSLEQATSYGMAKKLNEAVRNLDGLPARVAHLEEKLHAKTVGFTVFSNSIADHEARLAKLEMR